MGCSASSHQGSLSLSSSILWQRQSDGDGEPTALLNHNDQKSESGQRSQQAPLAATSPPSPRPPPLKPQPTRKTVGLESFSQHECLSYVGSSRIPSSTKTHFSKTLAASATHRATGNTPWGESGWLRFRTSNTHNGWIRLTLPTGATRRYPLTISTIPATRTAIPKKNSTIPTTETTTNKKNCGTGIIFFACHDWRKKHFPCATRRFCLEFGLRFIHNDQNLKPANAPNRCH